MNLSTQPSICVLIMSCDAYDDTWLPFLHFFDKYWKDCPYPVFFASNFKSPKHHKVTPILFNKSTNWSDELHTVLEKIPHTHIIYIQDDYFLLKNVDNSRIERLWQKMLHYNAAYLRLFPCPACDQLLPNETEIGLIFPETDQRTSLQLAIWEKESLMNLLNIGENPWHFEINAPARSAKMSKLFLSVPRTNQGKLENGDYPITYFCTAILKGKWMRDAYKLCQNEGLVLDTNRRKVQTQWEIMKNKIYENTPKVLQGYMWYFLNKVLVITCKTNGLSKNGLDTKRERKFYKQMRIN